MMGKLFIGLGIGVAILGMVTIAYGQVGYGAAWLAMAIAILLAGLRLARAR